MGKRRGKRRGRNAGTEGKTVKQMGDFGNLTAAAEKIVAAARARAGMAPSKAGAAAVTTWNNAANVAAGKTIVPATGGYVSRYSFACNAHQFAKPLFSIGAAHFYGGSRSQIEVRNWAMTVCLLGPQDAQTDGLHANDAAKALGFEARRTVPWLAVDCPDGGVPDLGKEDWTHIVDVMRERVRGNVGVYCLGGHGRTGMTLAILATLGGVVPEGEDPVTWLRARYCDEAVETAAQVNYISRITGRPAVAEGSHGPMFDYYGDWAPGGRVVPHSATQGIARAASTPGSVAITNAAGDVMWRADPAKSGGPVTVAPAATFRNEGEGFWCETCEDWIDRGDPVCADCDRYPYKRGADGRMVDIADPNDEDWERERDTPSPRELSGTTRELFEGFAPQSETDGGE